MTHSTTAPQASQEMLRSMMRTQPEVGKVTPSTRTLRRISTRDERIGTASLNTASFTLPASTTRTA